MAGSELNVVCLLVGDGLENAYVDRLYGMLHRFAGRPFSLTCLTDAPRSFSTPTECRILEKQAVWRDDMRPTQHKLRLFERGGWPFESFVYLDVTLIIHKSMEPLWRIMDSMPEPLALIQDWKWDTVNSCVMRIRRDSRLANVWDDYSAGTRYETRLNGDQDYLDASLRAHGSQEISGRLPSELIASYKELRRQNRLSPAKARQAFERSCIVKFHGRPRPHEIFEETFWRTEIRRNPLRALRDTRFLAKELREAWSVSL